MGKTGKSHFASYYVIRHHLREKIFLRYKKKKWHSLCSLLASQYEFMWLSRQEKTRALVLFELDRKRRRMSLALVWAEAAEKGPKHAHLASCLPLMGNFSIIMVIRMRQTLLKLIIFVISHCIRANELYNWKSITVLNLVFIEKIVGFLKLGLDRQAGTKSHKDRERQR